MNEGHASPSRRRFLSGLAAGVGASAYFTVPGLFAEELQLARTPRLTEGPFYSPRLALDKYNDLIKAYNAAVNKWLGSATAPQATLTAQQALDEATTQMQRILDDYNNNR